MKRQWLLLLLTFACTAQTFAQQATKKEYPTFEVFFGYTQRRLETERFDELERFAGFPASQVASNFNLTPAEVQQSFQDAFESGRTLHGFNVSGTVYLSESLGLTADFSYARSNETRTISNNQLFFEDTSRGKRHGYSFLVGPQAKFRKSRIEPFLHALFGVVRENNNLTLSIQSTGTTANDAIATLRLRDNYTAFNVALGGGIDVPINRHLTIRAIQVDYLPVFTHKRDARLIAPTGSGADGNSLGETAFAASRRHGLRISVGVVFR